MQKSQSRSRALHAVFAGSLLVPLLLAGTRAVTAHEYRLLLGLVAFTLGGVALIEYLARHDRPRAWFISIATLNVLLLTPELFLRQIGFYYGPVIQFGYPTAYSFQTIVADDELFWKLPQGRPDLNSLGFVGTETEVPKPVGVYRIAFFGDSLVWQGYPQLFTDPRLLSYPQVVEQLLNARRANVRVESANLGVPGYSTYQGRLMVEKYTDMIQPDLAVVSYVWNDHWQAYHSTDAQKKKALGQSWFGKFIEVTNDRSRLAQWLRSTVSPRSERPLAETRVPLPDFVANLTYIGQYLEARHVPVIFIVPATAYYTRGVPDYIVDQGFAADKESAVSLHRAYNQVVREVGAANHWLILDQEEQVARLGNADQLFLDDGIHLTGDGLAFTAQEITDLVTTDGLMPTAGVAQQH